MSTHVHGVMLAIASALAVSCAGIPERELRISSYGRHIPLEWSLPKTSVAAAKAAGIDFDTLYSWDLVSGRARFVLRFWPDGQLGTWFHSTDGKGPLPPLQKSDGEDLRRALPGRYSIVDGWIKWETLVKNDSGDWVLNPGRATMTEDGVLQERPAQFLKSREVPPNRYVPLRVGAMAGEPDW